MTKKILLQILVIIALASLLRFPLTAQGFFAFTSDQGRDLLKVKEVVEDKNLTLIGPTTGLPGIFYGPWWYYYLAPIYLISAGDPQNITLSFVFLGIISLVSLYLLIYKLTKNQIVSFGISSTAAMSQSLLASATQIWSPSLVPPLIIFCIFCMQKIYQRKKPLWFLLLGLTTGLIFDSEAAFGIVFIFSSILTSTFFPKIFLKKTYGYFFIGIFIVILPRILFELKNQFLISKAIINWISHPQIYQEKLSIVERIINRSDLFFLNFSQTLTQSDKLKAIIPLMIFVLLISRSRKLLYRNFIFKFLTLITLFAFIGFVIYPDAVWDYYLVGLPIITLTLSGLIFSYNYKSNKKIVISSMILIFLLNFYSKTTSPFAITWQGDGAIYRNQVKVMNSLQEKLKGDYSLYIYSPSGVDFPFTYLLQRYRAQGEIDAPKENQSRFYLIIRDDPTHTYLLTGWYGDKVKDRPTLRKRNEFPGNIIVEEHQVNG